MSFYVFATGTLIILVFSWYYSLRHGRYHGIPRFISFESIFLLVVLCYSEWFKDPLSARQILSWIFLILSAYTGIAGFVTLKIRGKSTGNFENTTVLVKSGIYSQIRHPLYLSLFCLGTGIMLKNPGITEIALGIINAFAVFFTARIEEREMIKKFGEQYKEYIRETKMFVPYLL